ncbi:MAG: OmpH family outer membrane protein [Bacteroidota bacterium]
MKKRFLLLALACTLLIPAALFAQNKQKIGHIDSNELLGIMPGRDSAKKVIENYAKSLDDQLTIMKNELQTKYDDYTANGAKYTDLIKQVKEKELVDLQKRIQDFQESAQSELQKKEGELMQPIIDKAKKAIEDVAKANGYTYIIDAGVGVLLYFEKGDDILPLVKKQLNLK